MTRSSLDWFYQNIGGWESPFSLKPILEPAYQQDSFSALKLKAQALSIEQFSNATIFSRMHQLNFKNYSDILEACHLVILLNIHI